MGVHSVLRFWIALPNWRDACSGVGVWRARRRERRVFDRRPQRALFRLFPRFSCVARTRHRGPQQVSELDNLVLLGLGSRAARARCLATAKSF